MLKPEQVPKEAADAMWKLVSEGGFTSTEDAIAAALNAWPGMLTERRARCDAVVLPFNLDADIGVIALPTENTNAEG